MLYIVLPLSNIIVLIVAKCIVNLNGFMVSIKDLLVLIVAKCIVNYNIRYFRISHE